MMGKSDFEDLASGSINDKKDYPGLPSRSAMRTRSGIDMHDEFNS